MHPAAPMPVPSPAGVRISGALLYGVAGLALLHAVVELIFTNTGLSVYRDAYNGDTGSGFGSLVTATLDICLAGFAAVLAVLNGHGRRNARLTTYVMGGLFLFCGGLGSLPDSFHGPSSSAGDSVFASITPAAYGLGTSLLHAVTLLAVLAALILLTLPSTTRYIEERQRPQYVYVPVPVPQPAADVPVQRHLDPHTGSIPAADPWAQPPAG
ncbi:hypothetical protein [Actinoplanes sp. RD1]|uniref:hypothetical protein n=1 Tax=Actinoplanes sp. RD1 TaxID=3064538 RepID=UPI002740EBB3|nr:hypothetical protein [Actinoplanes sp. RD1]